MCPSSLRTPPSGCESPPWGAHHGIPSTPLVPELTTDPVCGPKPTFVWHTCRCAAAAIGIRGAYEGTAVHSMYLKPSHFSFLTLIFLPSVFSSTAPKLQLQLKYQLASILLPDVYLPGGVNQDGRHNTCSPQRLPLGLRNSKVPPPSSFPPMDQLTPLTATKLKAPPPPTVVVHPSGIPSARAPEKLQTVPREP